MMAQILWFVLLIGVQQSWSQESSSTQASRDDSDPVGFLLSNLRSLVENPGAPFEDGYEFFPLEEKRRKEPMYGRPRHNYFKRIRDNYGKLQKNIGSMLDDLSLPKNLFGVNVESKEGSSTVDVKIPFFPVHVKVKNPKTQSLKEPVTQVPGFLEVFHKPKEDSVVEKSTKVGVSIPSLPIEVKVKSKVQSGEPVVQGEGDSKSSEESRKVRPQLSKVSTKVKVGDVVKVKVKVKSSDELKVVKRFGLQPSGWIELGESAGTGREKRDTTLSTFATEEQKEVFSKTYYDFMADPETDEDPGDVEVDIIDPVSGRFLSEVFYSEEAFDNMTKEAIKNAKWALDSDLAPSKILDKLDAVAKLVLSRPKPRTKSKRTPEDARLQARREAAKLPKLPFSRDEQPTERDVSSAEEKTEIDAIEPPRETVLIALTEGGIPVQIRIGPEVKNPYRFLHKILSASQVVLKIPAKEVLRNPASEDESQEIPPPVLHVDMSDLKQRSSFLKTLRKFRSDQN